LVIEAGKSTVTDGPNAILPAIDVQVYAGRLTSLHRLPDRCAGRIPPLALREFIWIAGTATYVQRSSIMNSFWYSRIA
jgi:hypothetical protein